MAEPDSSSQYMEMFKLYEKNLIGMEEDLISKIDLLDLNDELATTYLIALGDCIKERVELKKQYPYYYSLRIIIKYPLARSLIKNCNIV